MPPIGYFSFVLISHLPYVLEHGKSPHGEDWLYETVAESYIPLLNVLNRLVREGHSPKITICISPILAEQLSHPHFKKGFYAYLEKKLFDAADDRTHFLYYRNTSLGNQARTWQVFYDSLMEDFEVKYDSDILGAFKKLQDEGHIEIITTAASHAYLPMLSQDYSIDAQVKMAVKSHERHFGRKPAGFWMPECAFRPSYSWTPPVASKAGRRPYMRKGLEHFVTSNGMKYFMTDYHLLKGGNAIGMYMPRFQALRKLWGASTTQYHTLPDDEEKSAYQCYLAESENRSGKSPAFLTRDPKTAGLIWNFEGGFPNDADYLDFFKRYFPGRHRYWKVTSSRADLADKQEYDPIAADTKVEMHADQFVKAILNTLQTEHQQTGNPGIVCAPFDTELFGHWWFEGPRFLYLVLKGLAEEQERSGVTLKTTGEFVNNANPQMEISIPEGSWGEGGFHYIWLNEWTYWIWKHIYDIEVELSELVEEYGNHSDARVKEVLKQCARESLILQSSDWPFYLSTWTAREYVEGRFLLHQQNFFRLSQMVEHLAASGEVDFGEWNFYQDCLKSSRLFEDIEIEWFKE